MGQGGKKKAAQNTGESLTPNHHHAREMKPTATKAANDNHVYQSNNSAISSTTGTSSSAADSSDGSTSFCLKNDVQDTSASKCLKKVECLKGKAKVKETVGPDSSGGTESEPESSSADAASHRSSEKGGKSKRTKSKRRMQAKSNETSEASSSAPSSSQPGSCSEVESFAQNDEASTSASTLGADSSKEDSSGGGDLQSSTEGSGNASSADGLAWSVSEDTLLRNMKKSGDSLSWSDIGNTLNRSKSDVRSRWKLIKDQDPVFHNDSDDEQASSSKQSEGASESVKAGGAPSESQGAVAASSQTEEMPNQTANSTKKSVKEGKKKLKGKSTASTKWHQGERNEKVAEENKAAQKKAVEIQHRDRDILSGEEASSDSYGLPDEEDDEDDDEDYYQQWPEHRRHDLRYLHGQIYPTLYPSTRSPEPDEFFGEHDCAVLAAVESKYKQSKWLEMQANFYNVTGRLVPLHLIRDKCERAEQEELAAQEARRSRHNPPAAAIGKGRERVERWVSGVEQDGLEDPEQ